MRTLLIILCLSLWGISGVVWGQNQTDEGSVKAMKYWQIKGLSKSALRHGDYAQAQIYLAEWSRREPQNEEVKYQLGYCYEHLREYQLAARHYENIYKASPKTNAIALYRLALVQKNLGLYEFAIEGLEKSKRSIRKLKSQGVNRRLIDRHLLGCRLAINLRDSVQIVGIERINSTVNYSHKEVSPIILSESQIVYGSTKFDSTGIMNVNATNRPMVKPYIAKFVNGTWEGGMAAEAPFVHVDNKDWGKGVFSPDGNRFYVSYCQPNLRGKMLCHLYVSHRTNSGWTEPQKLGKSVNHKRYSSSQPAIGTCYDPNQDVLYFTSNRKGGAGGQDIWFSMVHKQTGVYKKAQNAGVFINTPGDEVSAFYDLTSHRIYFSSNGWTTLGGLDIFYANGEMVTWDEPQNLGLPYNSSVDDFDYVRAESGKTGLLVSNRTDDGLVENACCDDIFYVSESILPRVLVKGKLLREDEAQSFKTLTGKQDALLPEGQAVAIANKIIAVHTVRDSASVVFLKEAQTNEDGEFAIWLDTGADYKILVKDTTLLARSFEFTTKEVSTNLSEEMDIDVAPLAAKPSSSIVIDNIYYEFGSAELSHQAKLALDSTLVVWLKKFPSITVEIGSHTDNKGGERFNLRLSEKRANGVVDYLVQNGIPSNRLRAKGYGQSLPVAENNLPNGEDNPSGRQQNRRTEFKIIGDIND